MKNLTARFAVCCTAGMTLLLAGYAATREADVKALKDLEAQWNQEYVAKNLDKAVAHYAKNAILMAPGMPASVGEEAIRKAITAMVSDPAFSLKFQATRVEIAKSGDMGYTVGSYTMTMTDAATKKATTDHGSYLTTYAKQADGSWKAVADIATSEVPPPAK